MKREKGIDGIQAQDLLYRKYEVASTECSLALYDIVTPETVVGCHYATGQSVLAGVHGRVATIYFNPMHDSFMIMVLTPASRSNN